MMSTEFGG